MNQVAEVQGLTWDQVLGKPALEFLNILAYRKDKTEWEKAALEQWKRTH